MYYLCFSINFSCVSNYFYWKFNKWKFDNWKFSLQNVLTSNFYWPLRQLDFKCATTTLNYFRVVHLIGSSQSTSISDKFVCNIKIFCESFTDKNLLNKNSLCQKSTSQKCNKRQSAAVSYSKRNNVQFKPTQLTRFMLVQVDFFLLCSFLMTSAFFK